MLWFEFILGLKFLELVSILFAIVPEYGNEYTTKENTNCTFFKNFAPKLNLNHNIYIHMIEYMNFMYENCGSKGMCMILEIFLMLIKQ